MEKMAWKLAGRQFLLNSPKQLSQVGTLPASSKPFNRPQGSVSRTGLATSGGTTKTT